MRTRKIPQLRFPAAVVAAELMDKNNRRSLSRFFDMKLDASVVVMRGMRISCQTRPGDD